MTLSGSVEDRDAKRWAEDVAEHTGGVKHVQNNLRVEAALATWSDHSGSMPAIFIMSR